MFSDFQHPYHAIVQYIHAIVQKNLREGTNVGMVAANNSSKDQISGLQPIELPEIRVRGVIGRNDPAERGRLRIR